MLLVALILPPFIFTNPVFPTLPWKIPCVFPVKVTYKTSTKKNAKAKTKKLTYTMKVAKASVALSGDSAVAVGSTTKLTTTKKASSRAKITYTSSDETIATVSEDGTVKGVKAGKATITAKLVIGKDTATATQEVEVKKAILKSADQTEYNKIEAVIVGDTKDIKPADVKITNTATKATVAVKSISAKKGVENTYVIETFTGMTDAKEYSVEYAESTATFTATDNTVAKVALTKTEVPAGVKTPVQAVTKDAKGVVLGYFDLTNANSSKGQVTTALTITKGYVQGTDVYLPTVGDTMVAKITYHTGTFGTDGTETGKIEDTATITAVDPSTINYNYAVTIGKAPSWKASSFKANTAIKVGNQENAYFRITDENGNDVSDYTVYSVETADPTKLVVDATTLSSTGVGSNAVTINGVSAGDTYILVKKDGKVVFSLPVQVQGKASATSVDLNKTSVTVMDQSNVVVSIEAKLKDQYGSDMAIKSATVTNLAKPNENAKANFLTASVNDKKAVIAVTGSAFTTNCPTYYGTYTYKVTLKDTDNKEINRTFTVNFVKKSDTQAYQLSLPTEVNTTVGTDTAAKDILVSVSVDKMGNGAPIGTYSGDVEYTVKDSNGKDIDSKYIDKSGASAINIKAVSCSAITGGNGFQKNLVAGTYYVTAKFTVNKNTVSVSGSFTIKDEQDTSATINVKKNDLNGMPVADALANTQYAELTYDGLIQNISGRIIKVNSTPAGNTVYVTSIEVFVKMTGTTSTNYVLMTVPVNASFTNVAK
ncbi:MAG: Ig domain-containing protein [Roseburia faecis]